MIWFSRLLEIIRQHISFGLYSDICVWMPGIYQLRFCFGLRSCLTVRVAMFVYACLCQYIAVVCSLTQDAVGTSGVAAPPAVQTSHPHSLDNRPGTR